MFKISPDETLKIIQELYEKKLVTYPRTDARVLSTAVSKEIYKNIGGLRNFAPLADFAAKALDSGTWKQIAKTKYVNDKQITDHYAIIPTGQGMGALKGLPNLSQRVYDVIVRRFLSIFYPPAVYQKVSIVTKIKEESFFSSFKVLAEEGYLKVTGVPGRKNDNNDNTDSSADSTEDKDTDAAFFARIQSLKKGMTLPVQSLDIKEGKTSPP